MSNKKITKKLKSILGVILVFIIFIMSQISVMGATNLTKTVTSLKDLSIVASAKETADSNTITFNFSSLPDNAVVKDIKVDCSNYSHIGGMGAIVAQSLTIISPDGVVNIIPWKSGNIISTSLFDGTKGKGVWSVYMTGTNISSSYYGGAKYSNVEMTITYILNE